jgi:hypothetical protein
MAGLPVNPSPYLIKAEVFRPVPESKDFPF